MIGRFELALDDVSSSCLCEVCLVRRHDSERHRSRLPAIRHWAEPTHQVVVAWRNFVVMVTSVVTSLWSSAIVVVLVNRAHNVTHVTRAVDKRDGSVAEEW